VSKTVITSKQINDVRCRLEIGQRVKASVKVESKIDGNAKCVDGKIIGVFPSYFSVEYQIKSHRVRTSYQYQDLLLEKPLVRLVR
jgi:uncharacterized protein Veg